MPYRVVIKSEQSRCSASTAGNEYSAVDKLDIKGFLVTDRAGNLVFLGEEVYNTNDLKIYAERGTFADFTLRLAIEHILLYQFVFDFVIFAEKEYVDRRVWTGKDTKLVIPEA